MNTSELRNDKQAPEDEESPAVSRVRYPKVSHPQPPEESQPPQVSRPQPPEESQPPQVSHPQPPEVPHAQSKVIKLIWFCYGIRKVIV